MSKASNPQKATTRYSFLSAFIACMLWGTWAYYLNHESGTIATNGMASGITQGLASFVITLFLVHAVNWIYNLMPESNLAIIVPAIVTVSLTGSCLFLAHWLVGTPKIISTIIFPLSVAFMFCLYTTYTLWRQRATQEL